MQGKARTLQCGGEVAGEPFGGFRTVGLAAAQLFNQVTGIDTYRAALGTQPGRRAGINALIVVGRFQFGGVDARALLGLDIAPDHNALAWAQRQAF